MREYFPETRFSGGRVKIDLDLSNYATKLDLIMQQALIHQNFLKRLV